MVYIPSLFWLDILLTGQLTSFCPLFRPQSGQQKWLIYAVFEFFCPDGQIFFYLFKKKFNNIYKVRKKWASGQQVIFRKKIREPWLRLSLFD
ncbi:MAG: hypothetical protein U0K87_01045 [Ruminococcus sp.]|nr:hypothetical protein [Ruminococcus sp.]